MKKVTIDHIAKKSDIDVEILQKLFYDNNLIKKPDTKKIGKKIAKSFVRDLQGINKFGYSRIGFLDSFWASKIGYFALWLLALAWGIWLFSNLTGGQGYGGEYAGINVQSEDVQEELFMEETLPILAQEEVEEFGHFVPPVELPKTGASS